MNRARRKRILAYGAVAIFCGLLAGLGLAYWQIGEYIARRNLPASEQNPEVIARAYDGTVCLECSLFGPAIILFSFAIVLTTFAIWGAAELVISKKERAAIDR